MKHRHEKKKVRCSGENHQAIMSLSGGTKNNSSYFTKENSELSVSTPRSSKRINNLKNSKKQLLQPLNSSTSKREKVPKFPEKKCSDSEIVVEPLTSASSRVANDSSKLVKKKCSKSKLGHNELPKTNLKLPSIGKQKFLNHKAVNKPSAIKPRSKLKNPSYSHKKPKTLFQQNTSASPIPSTSRMEEKKSENESIINPIFETFSQQSTTTSPIPNPGNNEVIGKRKKIREGMIVSPKEMEYRLNAHKHSPNYSLLKKMKRFNTRFGLPTLSKDMEKDIFTPEELNSFSMNGLPEIENRMLVTVPGEKYAHIFKDMPMDSYDNSFNIKDENEMFKELCKNRKKGRPRSIGYRGVPISDKALDMHYGISVPSSSSSSTEKTKKNNC